MYYIKYWQVMRRKGIHQRSVYEVARLEWARKVSLESDF